MCLHQPNKTSDLFLSSAVWRNKLIRLSFRADRVICCWNQQDVSSVLPHLPSIFTTWISCTNGRRESVQSVQSTGSKYRVLISSSMTILFVHVCVWKRERGREREIATEKEMNIGTHFPQKQNPTSRVNKCTSSSFLYSCLNVKQKYRKKKTVQWQAFRERKLHEELLANTYKSLMSH